MIYIQCHKIIIKEKIRNKIFENNNVIYKTEIHDNKAFHLIKIDKMKNEKIVEYKPLITNANSNINNNKAKTKRWLKPSAF